MSASGQTPARSPRDHAFVRSADPNFGSAFGGACAEQVDGITCGWPESAHLVRQPEDPRGEEFDLFENLRPGRIEDLRRWASKDDQPDPSGGVR